MGVWTGVQKMCVRSLREADLFVSLFGGKNITPSDIITHLKLVEQLAHFHESMEWMSEVVGSVEGVSVNGNENVTNEEVDELLGRIAKLAENFKQLGSTSLLILYLEIRVHAFYYLSPIPQKSDFAPGVDNHVGDGEVTQLGKYLTEIEVILAASLTPEKIKYIFGATKEPLNDHLTRLSNILGDNLETTINN